MIKIIKNGKKKCRTKTIYKTTCPSCGCIYEFELEDCNTVEKRIGGAMTITCPFCGHIMTLYRGDPTKDPNYTTREEPIEIEKDETKKETLNTNKQIIELTSPWSAPAYDGCENCPNKDGPKDAFGNPIPGDSPCQFCRHYKWKITC